MNEYCGNSQRPPVNPTHFPIVSMPPSWPSNHNDMAHHSSPAEEEEYLSHRPMYNAYMYASSRPGPPVNMASPSPYKLKHSQSGNNGYSSISINLKGTELVVIRPQTTPPAGTSFKEEMVPRESAVCRFCFRRFLVNDENQQVLKTECKCSYTSSFIHYDCAIQWSRNKGNTYCERCHQVNNFLHVSILSQNPAPQTYYSAQPLICINSTGNTFPAQSITDPYPRPRRRWFWNLR